MQSNNRKGDIAIGTIFVLVVALISIFLLLSLFAVKIPFFSKDLYCKTFFHIQKSTFIPEGLRADRSYCKYNQALSSIRGNYTYAIDETAAAAVGCWQTAEYGKASVPIVCTQILYRSKEIITINETMVTQVLADNNVCDIFQNNDTGVACGEENMLIVKNITLSNESETSVLVEYDNTTRMIIVS